MSMLRRKVADRLVDAKISTAMHTTFNDVAMSAEEGILFIPFPTGF